MFTRSAGVNNHKSMWLIGTPPLEWYKAGLAFKNRKKDQKYMCYNEIGLKCSIDTILVSIAQHSWEDLWDHLKRKRIYALILDETMP